MAGKYISPVTRLFSLTVVLLVLACLQGEAQAESMAEFYRHNQSASRFKLRQNAEGDKDGEQ